MRKYNLSEALTQLPDEMLLEAQQAKRKKPALGRMLRAAACLCVVLGLSMWIFGRGDGIVTGPGLLTVMVYAEDGVDTQMPLHAVSPYTYDAWYFCNWAPGMPIVLSVAEDVYASENITFEVTTDGGEVYVGALGSTSIYPGTAEKMDTTFTVPNNTAIFWNQFTAGDTFWQDTQVAFMDIVIFNGETVIGYNCLRFDRKNENSMTFFVSMTQAVSFDAKQNITRDVLEDYIEKAHEQKKAA